MPASSAKEVSNTSTSYLLRSAQRMYIRISISAKSAASTPPAPERIVSSASRSSYSPERSVRTSRASTALWILPSSASASASAEASLSSCESCTMISTSSMRPSSSVKRSSWPWRAERRPVTRVALAWSSHRSGAATCSPSSAISERMPSRSSTWPMVFIVARSCLISTSKSIPATRSKATSLPMGGPHCRTPRPPARPRRAQHLRGADRPSSGEASRTRKPSTTRARRALHGLSPKSANSDGGPFLYHRHGPVGPTMGLLPLLSWRTTHPEEGRMAGKHRRIVSVHGDDTYERIYDLVRLGAVVSVEFVLADDRQMLATTTIVDDHGVTVDQAVVEV